MNSEAELRRLARDPRWRNRLGSRLNVAKIRSRTHGLACFCKPTLVTTVLS